MVAQVVVVARNPSNLSSSAGAMVNPVPAKPAESRKKRAAPSTAKLERSSDPKSDVTENVSFPGPISKRQRNSMNGAFGQAVATGPHHPRKRSDKSHLNGAYADDGQSSAQALTLSVTDAMVCYLALEDWNDRGSLRTLC